MPDWKQRHYPAGTEVKVFDVDAAQTYLGVGVLLYDYDRDRTDNPMPEIRMASGEILLGAECWWIPVAETTREDRA